MNASNKFNIELEQQVLGELINNNDKVCEVIDIIQPNDFYRNNHQIICNAIFEIYKSSKPIDITTIVEQLGESLVDIGGITYISELIASSFSSLNIKTHVEILKEKSNKRTLLKILNEAQIKIENENIKCSDLIEELNNKTLGIKGVTNQDTGNTKDGIKKLMISLKQRYENGGVIQGIEIGILHIDETINGLNKQDFIVIAARPAMGKTAFANNIAINVALRNNSKVSFFSLEMSKEQLLERMISSISNIEFEKIKKGKLNSEEWEELQKAAVFLNNPNLKVYDKVFSLNGIKAECKKRSLQGGLDIVIIDYLQLIESSRLENRQQQVSEISRQLKILAKELDCTVIALSQVSRACEQRADHRPMLSDLRESGAIEQDADIIMFLYRDEYYNPDTQDKDVMESIITKNRNGEVGTIKLLWLPQFQKVSEKSSMTYMGKYNPGVFNK